MLGSRLTVHRRRSRGSSTVSPPRSAGGDTVGAWCRKSGINIRARARILGQCHHPGKLVVILSAPGTGNLWEKFQDWRHTEKAKRAFDGALIGSPETIKRKLRTFQDAHVDQVILLNQAGKTSHEDICGSLKMFAEEVMPEFHGEEAAHAEWKKAVLSGDIVLEDLDVEKYDLYSHQNEDIVRLTPEQLKAQMAAKEAAAAGGDD